MRDETLYFHPLSDGDLVRAGRRLFAGRQTLRDVLASVWDERTALSTRQLRAPAHTTMGAALANYLAPFGIGHIHAHHGYFASWMALIASRLLGVSFSFTLHGSDLLVHADLLATKLRCCQFCATISEFNREYILRNYGMVPPSKILIRRLGVIRPIQGSNCLQASPLIFSAGRLHPVKNYQFLIEGCAALRDEGREFHCLIAGDGPEKKALEKQIDALQLSNRVRLLGMVEHAELAQYYQRAAVIVLTSRSEGIPVVLMEAMALGKIVLAPSITGIPELVEHGRTGFLYEPGSRSDFLANLRWILDGDRSLEKIREAAMEQIAINYDRECNVRRFADDFLERTGVSEKSHENSLLQQV
jgi:glycosyltransferase involved in cell wall biosynthesis